MFVHKNLLLSIIGLLIVYTSAELFTSLATLTKALQHEKDLADGLRKYVEAEKVRLEKVLKLASEYENHSKIALVDAEQYIANPVNAYLFVKKFTADIPETKVLLSSSENSQVFKDLLDKYNSSLPDEEDLDGIISALLRLQDTYHIAPKTIADGSFTPDATSPKLSAADCFFFAKKAHEEQDYYHVILWSQQALEAVERENPPTESKALMYDYYSYALYKQKNYWHAKHYTEKWLELDPKHPRARDNLPYFVHELEKSNSQIVQRGDKVPTYNESSPVNNPRIVDGYRQSQVYKDYEALCRGEDVIPNKDAHKLKCYYTTGNNHPILILAPVKVEEFFLSPRLVMFYDVISENEIAVVKEISIPKLKRATVNDPATGKLVHASYRVSRSGWLFDAENNTVKVLTNRISAVTGLNMERAEALQVQNYGIGGQYEPHLDHADDGKKIFDPKDGNRVATWIYYFGDVEAGGYTVFTSIGAKIPPKKGAAAFWHNLKKSGKGDDRTRHAGCPVLAGSKWVANKWMHERGQEFKRICGLTEDDETQTYV